MNPTRLLIGWALLFPAIVLAQTDEIQVYDASIADPGHVEVTFHSNYTVDGLKEPAFPGGIVPDHSVNGAFEWAYGFRDFWELGLYLPVYTITNDGDPKFDGFKLRSLWVTPGAGERQFFYGLNIELSYNTRHWDTSRTAMKARPILGWHKGKWDLILNPIFDSGFDGLSHVHLAPAERVAYNASDRWAVGLELYSDVGPLRQLDPWTRQSQTLFEVFDYTMNASNSLEFGVGQGLTAASDAVMLKLIWNHEL